MHPRKHHRVRPPQRNTGPLYVQVRSSQEGNPKPPGGSQVPPSEVRALAKSRGGEDLGTGKGPVPTRVQA
jgi:hypothetical protein